MSAISTPWTSWPGLSRLVPAIHVLTYTRTDPAEKHGCRMSWSWTPTGGSFRGSARPVWTPARWTGRCVKSWTSCTHYLWHFDEPELAVLRDHRQGETSEWASPGEDPGLKKQIEVLASGIVESDQRAEAIDEATKGGLGGFGNARGPAAFTRRDRFSRSTVQYAITGAQRHRGRRERRMVESHGRTDMPRGLKPRASGAMTGVGTRRAGHRRNSWRRLSSEQPRRHRDRDHDER